MVKMNRQQNMREEIEYLDKTLSIVRKQLENELGVLPEAKVKLIALRKDMWENTVHFSNDFARLTEMNQYLAEVNIQTANYENLRKNIEKYKKLLDAPYFGRFDFSEEGSGQSEKIYIGLFNVADAKAHNILVYDWRAPISSIFYRYEPGKASFMAPDGLISGEVTLKRQYKIQNSVLKYYFDCNVRINDEILQEVLSRNSSVKMRNIVETIQKEQDLVIRDTENDLLIVQGVAGSGKTSIALHRIAFLLYEGLDLKVSSEDIIIISPNTVFSKYISSVLPELGEENVVQVTFDDLVLKLINNRVKTETRNKQLEFLIAAQDRDKIQSIEFKGSGIFVQVLDRMIRHWERRIAFPDIYYDGQIIETRHQLKNRFLNSKKEVPMAKRLKRLEDIILEKIQPLQKKRLTKIKKIVEKSEGRDFEIKSFSRLLSIKKSSIFLKNIRSFTRVDYLQLYRDLFNQPGLFFKLAEGLPLPNGIEKIIKKTGENLENNTVCHEDCAPLLYLKLKIEGSGFFPGIKQVVIDEIQDYYPVQYEVFKMLFKDARYTLLGDINQAIEKDVQPSLYDIEKVFNKEKTVKLFLNKSYRSSYEINSFTRKLAGGKQEFVSFKRHEKEPVFVYRDSFKKIDEAIVEDIDSYLGQGYQSVAVVTKTARDAEKLYRRLKNLTGIKLVNSAESEIEKGVSVIPSYMAKGLEFDVVLIYDVSAGNYQTDMDRKLLYIACTRAVHRLALYYTGERSPFFKSFPDYA